MDKVTRKFCWFMVGGRGTQLKKIADALLKSGCSTISFDAPAHGKSPNQTIMTDFIAAILEIENNMGL
jgi:alpha-beta hydrolase superfamily lysophospholipase